MATHSWVFLSDDPMIMGAQGYSPRLHHSAPRLHSATSSFLVSILHFNVCCFYSVKSSCLWLQILDSHLSVKQLISSKSICLMSFFIMIYFLLHLVGSVKHRNRCLVFLFTPGLEGVVVDQKATYQWMVRLVMSLTQHNLQVVHTKTIWNVE